MTIFGYRLKELREDSNLTLKALATKIHVSDAAICKWENNIAEPKASYIKNLSEVLNVSTDYLLGRTDDFGNITIIPETASQSGEERELIRLFRELSPSLRGTALDMIRTLAGKPIQSTLHKNA